MAGKKGQTLDKKPLSVYVHVPFCKRKCLYCDFPSAPGTPEEIAFYFRILMQEIRSFEALDSLYTVSTVFFGGGTPSLVDPKYIRQVLDLLRAQYHFEEDPEISLEANPGTLTQESLAAYRDMGISRLSIGLQSANEDELKILGRIHSFEDFQKSYELAREAGFANINIDLMSALPRQTMEKWQRTLQIAADLKPEHISAYSLIIEEGTPFAETWGTGVGRVYLPGEDLDREMYHYTKEFLASRGYERYEISNYALPGFESRHNMTYWTGGDYVGFGQSAASYLDGRRFQNPAEKTEYLEEAREAYGRFKSTRPLSLKSREEEYMFLGLRTHRGVSREEFKLRFGESFPGTYEKKLLDYCMQGFMEKEDDRIRLTDKGIDVSNVIMADFLQD
ncbi:MAG: oxygen-independent coproporphyrinogen III oxidase [Lachnospiraceae bacterium]|nr:oxygen-independent coproporphyrinogen III oxidase [Lachnospiraceae bacterium]